MSQQPILNSPKTKRNLAVYTLLLMLLSSTPLFSQKVGLVLSGGGAKGFAHIGVIRALEEKDIPIDYITGTSMGAVIGSLYASGYSPDEMYELFKSEKFRIWAKGKIENNEVYYFKRNEANASMVNFRLVKDQGKYNLRLPTNIIPETQMDFAFMELYASTSAACNYNFDHLMVPFRCIASDIYNNKEVILKNGELGEAVRASMTFPLFFKPIEINNDLLFDGGMVNNFPTDVMLRDFKPDILIGHKVASDLSKPNPDDIIAQLENMVMQQTNYQIPDSLGTLLETHFEDVGLLDIDRLDFASEEGYRTAQKKIDEICQKIQRRISPNELKRKRQNFKNKRPQLLFQDIEITGVKNTNQAQYIQQSIKKDKSIINISDFKRAYFRLIADQQIKSILPTAKYNKETGYFDLKLKVKSHNTFNVLMGGNISSQTINQGFLGINYSFHKKNAYLLHSNFYFGRFYNSVQIGGRMDFPSYYPIALSGSYTHNNWDFFSSSTELFFEDSRPSYIKQQEDNIRLYLSLPVGFNKVFKAGFSLFNAYDNYYQKEKYNKYDIADQTQFKGLALYSLFEKNTLDDKQYALSGIHRIFSLKWVTGRELTIPGSTSENNILEKKRHNYFELQLEYQRIFKLHQKLRLGILGKSIINNKAVFSNYTATTLNANGFNPTPHSKTLFINDFHSNRYVASGVQIISPLFNDFQLRVEAYSFLPLEDIIAREQDKPELSEFSLKNIHSTFSTTLVYKTFFGPISFSANYYEKPGDKWFFVLNFGYTLFNARGF